MKQAFYQERDDGTGVAVDGVGGCGGCVVSFGGAECGVAPDGGGYGRGAGAEAVKVKDDVLAHLSPMSDPVGRNEYGAAVVKEFEKELTSANSDARLNTAILMEKLETLTCDHVLEKMLKSDDPSVRLWGAKGLAAIASIVKKVGGRTLDTAVGALKDAQGRETSEVIKDQISQTLLLY